MTNKTDTPKIYPAMIAVMRSIGAIGKSEKNQQQNFNYRGIDSVYNHLHELMAQQGIFTTSRILSTDRQERTTAKGTVLAFVTLTIEYTFHAEDGSSVTTVVVGEGMDSGDKASNKAMAIAHKYALLQTFLVPTAEQKDPDAESHEVVPQQRPAPAYTQADIDACIKATDEATTVDALLKIRTKAKNGGYLAFVDNYTRTRKAQIEAAQQKTEAA